MNIESVSIDSLTLDPENARRHSPRNIEAIAQSLKTFGQRRPLVVWDDIVIAGNGTIEAAKSLGWKKVEISRVPEDWTQEQARAYALADNRTAELAEWDGAALLESLESLPEDLLQASGFDDGYLQDLEKLWGAPPDLDDLHDDLGGMTEEDGLIVVRFKIPPYVHEKWQAALKATGQEDMEAIALLIQAAFDALTDGEI
jgi:ParB-like chromosome segregation protein Spo0J